MPQEVFEAVVSLNLEANTSDAAGAQQDLSGLEQQADKTSKAFDNLNESASSLDRAKAALARRSKETGDAITRLKQRADNYDASLKRTDRSATSFNSRLGKIAGTLGVVGFAFTAFIGLLKLTKSGMELIADATRTSQAALGVFGKRLESLDFRSGGFNPFRDIWQDIQRVSAAMKQLEQDTLDNNVFGAQADQTGSALENRLISINSELAIASAEFKRLTTTDTNTPVSGEELTALLDEQNDLLNQRRIIQEEIDNLAISAALKRVKAAEDAEAISRRVVTTNEEQAKIDIEIAKAKTELNRALGEAAKNEVEFTAALQELIDQEPGLRELREEFDSLDEALVRINENLAESSRSLLDQLDFDLAEISNKFQSIVAEGLNSAGGPSVDQLLRTAAIDTLEEQLRALEIANVQLRVRSGLSVKETADAIQEITAETNAAKIELAQLREEEARINAEIFQDRVDAISNSIQDIIGSLTNAASGALSDTNEAISQQVSEIDRLRNTVLDANADIIQSEEDKLDRLLDKRRSYTAEVRALAQLEFVAQIATAVARAAAQAALDGGLSAVNIFSTIAAVTAAVSQAKSLAIFHTGTEAVKLDQSWMKNGHREGPAIVQEDERILSKSDNSLLRGMSNKELVRAGVAWSQGFKTPIAVGMGSDPRVLKKLDYIGEGLNSLELKVSMDRRGFGVHLASYYNNQQRHIKARK